MRTALRIALCVVMAAAALAALARSPLSNGTGDGEANVPFATEQTTPQDELGGGSGEPGARAEAPLRVFARSPLSNGCGDGEANVPFATIPQDLAVDAAIGGGSGEPGRAEPALDDAAARAREREFEQHVWTDP